MIRPTDDGDLPLVDLEALTRAMEICRADPVRRQQLDAKIASGERFNSVAVLAKHHKIPFYVVAPSSTFDLSLSSGKSIPIEQRDPREVTDGFGKQTAPTGVKVYNPAFDVTPAGLIAGIITEKRIIRPVTAASIRKSLS